MVLLLLLQFQHDLRSPGIHAGRSTNPDAPDAILFIEADDFAANGRFDLIAPWIVLWELKTVWAVPSDETEPHTAATFPVLVVII